MIKLFLISFALSNFLLISGRIIEGDIKIDDTDTFQRSIGDKKTETNRWPNGIVPYTIALGFDERERGLILSGMELITKKTSGCIQFVEKNATHLDWVDIVIEDGCWSHLGRVVYRRSQKLSLGSGCVYLGIIVHEFCHAIGLHHEQTRPDRDNYITINYANIQSGSESQFNKQSPDSTDTFKTQYDYYSIMHYNEYAFAKNRYIQTIVPKDSSVRLIPSYEKTKEQVLTDIDVSGIQAAYECYNNKPATDSSPEPATDSSPEPATDSSPQPVSDSSPQPVTDSSPQPLTETTTKQVNNFKLTLLNNLNRAVKLYRINEEDFYFVKQIKRKEKWEMESYVGEKFSLSTYSKRKKQNIFTNFTIGEGLFRESGLLVKTKSIIFGYKYQPAIGANEDFELTLENNLNRAVKLYIINEEKLKFLKKLEKSDMWVIKSYVGDKLALSTYSRKRKQSVFTYFTLGEGTLSESGLSVDTKFIFNNYGRGINHYRKFSHFRDFFKFK